MLSMKYIWISLLFLFATTIQAKPTIIEGTFLYQKNEKFCIGIIENNLLDELECWKDTISDEKGNFKVNIDLEEEKILVFKSTHGKFKFYAKPSDSLFISILNIWNIKFTGASSFENNWMIAHKFHQLTTSFPNPFDSWMDEKQRAQIDFEENMGQLEKVKDQVSEYFYSYAKTEILGMKYRVWCRIHADLVQIKRDFEMISYMENEIKTFLNEPIIDDISSHNYHYSMVYCDKFIPVNPSFNQYSIADIWQKVPNDTTKQVLQHFKNFPNLYKSIQYLAANGLINNAKDSTELFFAKRYVTYLSDLYPKQGTNKVLNNSYYEMSRTILLTKAEDFKVLDSHKDTFNMSELIDQKTLLVFYTLNQRENFDSLQNSINSFVKMIKHPEEFNIVAVYVSDSLETWLQHIATLKKKENCYFLCENQKETVKKDYYLKTLPYCMMVEKDLKISKKSAYFYGIFTDVILTGRN